MNTDACRKCNSTNVVTILGTGLKQLYCQDCKKSKVSHNAKKNIKRTDKCIQTVIDYALEGKPRK